MMIPTCIWKTKEPEDLNKMDGCVQEITKKQYKDLIQEGWSTVTKAKRKKKRKK